MHSPVTTRPVGKIAGRVLKQRIMHGLLTFALLVSPAYSTELVVSTSDHIRTLDPAQAYEWENFHITATIGAGLLRWDAETAAPRLDLAKQVDVLDKGTRLVFTLHEDIRFQNGRRISAHDFVYSFNRILNPKTASPFAGFYANVLGTRDYAEGKSDHISGIVATSDTTLEISLSAPDASLLTVLSMPFGFVVPEEEVEKPGFADRPIGAGPYRVGELNDEQLVLEKSEYYLRGNPKSVDKVILNLTTRSGSRTLLDIEREKVHFAEFHYPTVGSSRFSADDIYKDLIRYLNEHSTIYVSMNMKSGPLTDHRLRRAINLGVDKQSLISRHIQGKVEVARHILPPPLAVGRHRRDVFDYDPRRAKALVKQAGYAKGLVLSLLAQDTKQNRLIVKQIAKNLLLIGITVNPDFVSTGEFFDITQSANDYNLFYSDGIAWIADYPDAANFYFPLFTKETIDNGFNWSGFSNDDIHKRALAINSLIGEEFAYERQAAWDELLFEIHERHTPWLSLFHRRRPILVAQNVRGLDPFLVDGVDSYIFENLWLED